MSKIDVVTGAQYGSEGKGHVTAQLVIKHRDLAYLTTNIRVAGPNAGHTVVDASGTAHALRTIPVAAALNHHADLVIAPGSEIDLEVLTREVLHLRMFGHPVEKLYISGEATLIEDSHKETELNRKLADKIGSTAKGIGAARAERIMRDARRVMDSNLAVETLKDLGAQVLDAEDYGIFIAQQLVQTARRIVIEGTQGYGLGLHAGHYPQCTSSDARAIDFLAMAGISPWAMGVNSVTPWLVARVYPIRVAGNSGPMEGETTWEDLGLAKEYTTVTHKTRRVGIWDSHLIRAASIGNGIAGTDTGHVALTMADQKIPGLLGMTQMPAYGTQESRDLTQLIDSVEHDARAKVRLITTSSDTCIWRTP
jgi:adenylosuccinate synthase